MKLMPRYALFIHSALLAPPAAISRKSTSCGKGVPETTHFVSSVTSVLNAIDDHSINRGSSLPSAGTDNDFGTQGRHITSPPARRPARPGPARPHGITQSARHTLAAAADDAGAVCGGPPHLVRRYPTTANYRRSDCVSHSSPPPPLKSFVYSCSTLRRLDLCCFLYFLSLFDEKS